MFRRSLLERVSLEASEVDNTELHRAVSYLSTCDVDHEQVSHGVSALEHLLAAAESWRSEAFTHADPKPGKNAVANHARLRELLEMMRGNLALQTDLIDAMLAVPGPTGGET